MALRLFALRRHDSKVPEGRTFSDLMMARKERDRLTAINKIQYVVCPGPDHKKYKQWLVEIKQQLMEEET
jgi:hypothetical protein